MQFEKDKERLNNLKFLKRYIETCKITYPGY